MKAGERIGEKFKKTRKIELEKETFPNCTSGCKFKIGCGRFDDKKTIFYCIKNKCIYQKRTNVFYPKEGEKKNKKRKGEVDDYQVRK